MFDSIITNGVLTFTSVSICTLASIVLGVGIGFSYMIKSNYTKNFVITLSLLPVIVQIVIMMVNGSIGTGVAVLGAFSLIRFRSVPGSSKEILSIFFSMAVGLATGMGYVAFAVLFTLIIGGVFILFKTVPFGEQKIVKEKHLKIVIPEDLDYTDVFSDIFKKYLKKYTLYKVKTSNMGSMFELSYRITVKNVKEEKLMLDEIRIRNGNLPIVCGNYNAGNEEL